MSKQKQATRDRILDAAERLFAEKGFEGVSVREITGAAEADVSLAYYHFKSKRDLFDQVMLRRVDYLNEIRFKALEEVERRHVNDKATLEEIVGAVTSPLLELLASDHEEWKYYLQLVAQINSSPAMGGELMTRYFDPLIQKFLSVVRENIPDCEDIDLYWAYHFMSGALTLTFAETGRIDNLSGGICRSSDMVAINERMPKFLAAGFRALCQES
jgi:AcrR family transcriptional regulator